MVIKTRKHPTLEGILEEFDGIRPHLEEGAHIYVPDHPGFLTKIKDYWFNLMNKAGPITASALRGAPGGEINYLLWKMPPRLHAVVNRVLDYTSIVLRKYQPEGAVYTGLLSGASRLIYGIKTRSGKDVVSGLVGSLGHLNQIDDPKIKSRLENLYDESMKVIEEYFGHVKELDENRAL